MSVCAFCGAELLPPPRQPLSASAALAGVRHGAGGRPRRFCDSSCRKAAARRRAAGLDENAYADGGRRGRVPLDQATHAETRERWQRIAAELRAAGEQLQADGTA